MNRVTLPLGTPNPMQKRVLDSYREGKRIVLFNTGRQGGKSHLGARWLLDRISKPNQIPLSIMVSPSYRMARVMTRKFEEVLQSDQRLWKRVKVRQQPIPTFQFPNGHLVEVHSSDNPDSLRGLTAANIWFDEIALAAQEAFDIVMPTLLASNGYFLGTTTPRGRQNWTYRHLYLRAVPPEHPDHNPDLYDPSYGVVTGSTWENVENLSEGALRLLESQYGKGSSFERQEVGGEFVSFEGLVYTWDEERNYLAPDKLPPIEECSLVIGGLDFGWHPDPTAAYVLGYKDGTWYVYDGLQETKLFTNDLASELEVLGSKYKVVRWYADSARPDEIEDLKRRGIPVTAVKKPEIAVRIKEMAIFADNNRLKVSYRAPDVRNELQTYEYPTMERLLRQTKPNPIDKNNHAMDAIGYAIWSVRYLWATDNSYKIVEEEIPDMEDPFAPKAHGAGTTGTFVGLYGR